MLNYIRRMIWNKLEIDLLRVIYLFISFLFAGFSIGILGSFDYSYWNLIGLFFLVPASHFFGLAIEANF